MAGELTAALLSDLRADFKAGVEDMVDCVKRAAPVDTGALRSSIRASVGSFEAVISTNTGEEYPGILEAGSGPYRIRARSAQALFWEGAAHPVKEVNHPGSTKHKGWWTDAMVEADRKFDARVGC